MSGPAERSGVGLGSFAGEGGGSAGRVRGVVAGGGRVYVSGPYTKGDVVVNVRAAVLAGDELFRAGFFPFVPHLTHLWHTIVPHPWEDWLRLDLAWIDACHALIRLPGESKGADMEVAYAQERGVPVWHSVADFIADNAE